eukprot:TRINITY_DN14654_c0_g1_i1.p1 TRINITY_DN14654_c0_g1~~TRINITY_DN14654_c0_g1_i1.p1  ORF type:complete len:250 (+),score=49.03 TRINITY_DN14654_c0_g1_i1:65-751(+)
MPPPPPPQSGDLAFLEEQLAIMARNAVAYERHAAEQAATIEELEGLLEREHHGVLSGLLEMRDARIAELEDRLRSQAAAHRAEVLLLQRDKDVLRGDVARLAGALSDHQNPHARDHSYVVVSQLPPATPTPRRGGRSRSPKRRAASPSAAKATPTPQRRPPAVSQSPAPGPPPLTSPTHSQTASPRLTAAGLRQKALDEVLGDAEDVLLKVEALTGATPQRHSGPVIA